MGLRPQYRIEAEGEDITALLNKRLIDMTITDEAGYRSDELKITLSDADPEYPLLLPRRGAELAVWLGYDDTAERMGVYIVDELRLTGSKASGQRVEVKAKASPQTDTRSGLSQIQTQRSRSWEAGTTIGAMVRTIAEEHGLKPAVDPELDGVELPHIDQVGESDISLLTRIARDYDAVAKPGGGALAFARRGQARAVSGEQLTTLDLVPAQVSDWTVTLADRWPVGTAVAVYHDNDEGSEVEVTAGQGEPIHRLRVRYPSRQAAEAAARAAFNSGNRRGGELRVTMAGDPTYQPEAIMSLRGFRDGVDGQWRIEKVTHTLRKSGYSMTVEATAFAEPDRGQSAGRSGQTPEGQPPAQRWNFLDYQRFAEQVEQPSWWERLSEQEDAGPSWWETIRSERGEE